MASPNRDFGWPGGCAGRESAVGIERPDQTGARYLISIVTLSIFCLGHSYDADPVEAVLLTCIEDGAFPSS